MDIKMFWLLGLVFIGLSGAGLTFARRYKNQDEDAGSSIAGWVVGIIILWMLIGLDKFF